jgi:hypothetical protein
VQTASGRFFSFNRVDSPQRLITLQNIGTLKVINFRLLSIERLVRFFVYDFSASYSLNFITF